MTALTSTWSPAEKVSSSSASALVSGKKRELRINSLSDDEDYLDRIQAV